MSNITAMRATEIREAAHRFEPTILGLELSSGQHSRRVATELRATLDALPVGTMREWMTRNNGSRVTTMQVHNTGGHLWATVSRTIEADRATYVTLGGFRSDYDGTRVVATTSTALIVTNSWHTTAYILEP